MPHAPIVSPKRQAAGQLPSGNPLSGPSFRWIDCFPGAVCVADSNDRIVAMNAHAKLLLKDGAILVLPADGKTQAIKQKGLVEAIRRARASTPLSNGEAAVAQRANDEPPLYALARACPEYPDHVLIWFCDPRERRIPPSSHLRVWFKLSTAEARIARMLCLGHTLSKTAKAGGLSRHTPRNQLQRVFEKTTVSPQPALVSFLTAGLPSFSIESNDAT